jgi:hypothetical protein
VGCEKCCGASSLIINEYRRPTGGGGATLADVVIDCTVIDSKIVRTSVAPVDASDSHCITSPASAEIYIDSALAEVVSIF